MDLIDENTHLFSDGDYLWACNYIQEQYTETQKMDPMEETDGFVMDKDDWIEAIEDWEEELEYMETVATAIYNSSRNGITKIHLD